MWENQQNLLTTRDGVYDLHGILGRARCEVNVWRSESVRPKATGKRILFINY